MISFYAYCSLPHLRFISEALEAIGRPTFCTEWMARGVGSRINDQLPYFRAHRIGAFQWGLVRGKSQTHLPWPGVAVATPLDDTDDLEWFHDILTGDGVPYSLAEVETIRQLVGPAA